MSLDQATTPTDAAGQPVVVAPPGRRRIEYFRAYQAVLDSPNWIVNLLWGMLAVFSSGVIPIVGTMLWTGYTYECVERLHLSRGRELPDFDVNRFGDYLTRGVFPFCVQLANWFALGATYILLYIFMVLVAVAASAVGEEHLAIVLTIGGMLYAFTVAAVILLPMILLFPLMLRLGLSQDLAIGFKLTWWGDFLRRMWLEIVLTTLFVLMTGTMVLILGCFLVFIGFYAAWAWVTLANAHLSWQLYELYLARGGEPVPLKPVRLIPPLPPPGGCGLPAHSPTGNPLSPPAASTL